MSDSDSEWWDEVLSTPHSRPSAPHPVVESAVPSAPRPVVESVLPSAPRPVVESVLPSAPHPVVESVLPSAPHPLVESVLPSAPEPVVESVLPSAPGPVLLPFALPDTPQRQAGAGSVALARARAQADASDMLIRSTWWRALLPNGILSSITWEADVFVRFPLDEPTDAAQWLEHLMRQVRSLSSRYFYIGITDNPAHRWQMHVHSRNGWSAMYVIGFAQSSRTTGAWERALIQRFRNPLMCHNIAAGGEGASGGSPHFVYCICRSDALLRRAPGGGGGTRRDRMERVEDFLAEHRI